ncbi:hypothetical protein D9M70_604270 [compost metagenome]
MDSIFSLQDSFDENALPPPGDRNAYPSEVIERAHLPRRLLRSAGHHFVRPPDFPCDGKVVDTHQHDDVDAVVSRHGLEHGLQRPIRKGRAFDGT